MTFSHLSLSGPVALNGVIVNAPLTGNEFYVDSNLGSNSRDGTTPADAKATLASALDLCTASKNDTIYLMPGHVESMGDAQIAIDVVGVNVVGLGHGASRPRFDYDHANSSIDIEASNCTLRNITIRPSVTDVLVGIDVVAAVTGTLIEDVEALPGEDAGGVDDFALVVDVKAGCTDTTVRGLKVRQHLSGAGYIAGVRLTGQSDDILIEGCDIYILGAGVLAPINGVTTLSTNVMIRNNILWTDHEPGIELLVSTTGIVSNNYISSNLATLAASIVASHCYMFENYNCENVSETGALVGTASADD